MNEKISSSINFLMSEYQRLLKKEKKGTLTKSELETLNNLKNFFGKK